MEKTIMEKLTEDVLIEILARVPASSLIQVKLTSKSWYALISHPLFVKLHSERLRTDTRAAHPKILIIDHLSHRITVNGSSAQSIDFEEFEGYRVDKAIINLHDPFLRSKMKVHVGGSCDGLICFVRHSYQHHVISLWNPFTKKVRDLPDCSGGPYSGLIRSVTYGVGLGYDRGTDDYKVVRAVHSQNAYGVKETMIDIFALKTNVWRRIHDKPRGKLSRDSLFLNGALHWFISQINEAEDSHAIISFDLAKEKFQEVPIPERSESTKLQGIGILDGCLLVYTVYWQQNGRLEAWAMKEYGVKTSWAKVFSISGALLPAPSTHVQLICIKNGKILLGLDWNEIVLFDIEERSCRFLLDTGWSGSRYEFAVYVESLSSPYSGDGTTSRLKYSE